MANRKQITVLVTGASSGIGKATAEQLLADGYTVYVAARRVEKMADLAERGATPLKMDITQAADVEAVVHTIQERSGGVDILINNAGYALYGPVEHTDIDAARQQFEVNIFGLAHLTQLVLPHMRAQKRGKIINVSSVAGKIYTPLGAWYHATKHALEGWSDALRLELKPFGVDVVIIQPGGIETEFLDVMNAPLLERSRGTAYEQLAEKVVAYGQRETGAGKFSNPAVIARTIAKAVAADRPSTRYAAGYMASTVLFLRRWLSDGWFDRAMLSQMK